MNVLQAPMFVILWEELAPIRILITIASVLMVAQLRRGRIPPEPVVNQEVFEVQNYSGEFLRLCKLFLFAISKIIHKYLHHQQRLPS